MKKLLRKVSKACLKRGMVIQPQFNEYFIEFGGIYSLHSCLLHMGKVSDIR